MAGVWDAAPSEMELLVQADKLVGGTDAVLLIDDTAVPKKGKHSVGVRNFGAWQERHSVDNAVLLAPRCLICRCRQHYRGNTVTWPVASTLSVCGFGREVK